MCDNFRIPTIIYLSKFFSEKIVGDKITSQELFDKILQVLQSAYEIEFLQIRFGL